MYTFEQIQTQPMSMVLCSITVYSFLAAVCKITAGELPGAPSKGLCDNVFMSSPVYGPEILTSPTTDRITTAAEKIISVLGVITPRYGRRTLQARVSMDTSEFMEIPDTAFPLLTITKPLGDVAERALFKYAFLYVPHFSKLANTQVVLFAGDTPAGRIEHPGNADGVPLMEPEALKLAADLEKIAEI